MKIEALVRSIFSMEKEKRYKELSGKNKLKNLENLVQLAKEYKIPESDLNPTKIASWLTFDFDKKGKFYASMNSEIKDMVAGLIAREYAGPIKTLEELQEEKAASEERHRIAYALHLKKKKEHEAGWFHQMYLNDPEFRAVIDDPANYGGQ